MKRSLVIVLYRAEFEADMRINWDGYVNSQLAWWSALTRLSSDPHVADPAYVKERAHRALINARDAIDEGVEQSIPYKAPIARLPEIHLLDAAE